MPTYVAALLANINAEAAMVMVVVMMMVMVMMVMPVRWGDNAVIAVVMVMMMVVVVMARVILRDLFSASRLCRSDAGIIDLQRI